MIVSSPQLGSHKGVIAEKIAAWSAPESHRFKRYVIAPISHLVFSRLFGFAGVGYHSATTLLKLLLATVYRITGRVPDHLSWNSIYKNHIIPLQESFKAVFSAPWISFTSPDIDQELFNIQATIFPELYKVSRQLRIFEEVVEQPTLPMEIPQKRSVEIINSALPITEDIEQPPIVPMEIPQKPSVRIVNKAWSSIQERPKELLLGGLAITILAVCVYNYLFSNRVDLGAPAATKWATMNRNLALWCQQQGGTVGGADAKDDQVGWCQFKVGMPLADLPSWPAETVVLLMSEKCVLKPSECQKSEELDALKQKSIDRTEEALNHMSLDRCYPESLIQANYEWVHGKNVKGLSLPPQWFVTLDLKT